MENLNSLVDADASSIIQHSILNYSNLLNDIEELEIDWTDFNPIPFGIPSPDPNPLPVRLVEMPQFDSTGNIVFETSPPQPSPSRNQMVNTENDSSRLAPFVSPRPNLSSTPCVAMPPPPPPSPPRNQTMSIENGFNPTSFVITCPEPNPTLERQVEMPRFDPTENMAFEMPWIATSSSSSSPPRNQTISGENSSNPTSFVIPYPDPNPTPRRQVEMPRFDPTENMVIENSWIGMQPSSSSLPCNQTMNIENNFNPTPFFIPCLDSNPELVRPVEMHRFNPIENMVFENQWIASSSSSSPPRNQTTNTENDFRPFGHEYKTNADIICENYLGAYRVDSSSIRTAVDRSCAAFNNFLNFNDNNGLLFSSDSEMQYFPAASSSSTEFSPPCNEVEAATHGGADSSAFKRKWSVQEHKLLLVGMEIFGKGDWTNIANKVVITKSNTQVSSHAQKYFLRLTLPIGKKGKRSSIHDITTVDPELLWKVRARLGLPSSSLPPPPSNE